MTRHRIATGVGLIAALTMLASCSQGGDGASAVSSDDAKVTVENELSTDGYTIAEGTSLEVEAGEGNQSDVFACIDDNGTKVGLLYSVETVDGKASVTSKLDVEPEISKERGCA